MFNFRLKKHSLLHTIKVNYKNTTYYVLYKFIIKHNLLYIIQVYNKTQFIIYYISLL